MQDNVYRTGLLFAMLGLEQTVGTCFHFGMSLAFVGELKEIGDVLEETDTLEYPIDILDTMEEPLIRRLHKLAHTCLKTKEQLMNLNNLSIDEALDSDEFQRERISSGHQKQRKPTRKQILNF